MKHVITIVQLNVTNCAQI